jgi:hypothetical protein
MNHKAIRHIQQTAWPAVRDSLERVKAARALANQHPERVSQSARNRARISWNRCIADETVWALVKADLIATPEQQAVVKAAKEWVASWKRDGEAPSLSTGDHRTDVDLYNAVQELAVSIEIPHDVDF